MLQPMPDYSSFNNHAFARQDGHLLVVSLNRPERLNAMGGAIQQDLTAVLETARDDRSVRAILLRGEGRAFCAGGDVKDFDERASGPQSPTRVYDTVRGSRLIETVLSVPQPMVAAVHGYAMGLGSTLALLCDVVIAADDATFSDSHVNIGIVAGDGGAVLWPLLLPFGAAKWYLLTGDRISGAEAARIGLILRSVPAEKLLEEATAVARRLADGAPLAVQGTKATINRILRERIELLLETGLLYEGATYMSEDHREAAAAFVAKRTPTFTGK
jgi:enoyl-CoA hydratase